MIRKWIKCAGERIEDRLRRVCGAMNPDIRVYAIVTLFVLFAALSLYSTVRRAEDAAGSGDAQSRVSCPAAAPAGITRKPLNIHKPNTLKKDKL
jgi:hypothetical protein